MTNLNVFTMKKLIQLVLVVCICGSCGVDRIYTSGSYGALKSYRAKPAYHEQNDQATYISAAIKNGKHRQTNPESDDKKTLFTLSAHRAVTKKHWNYYYGLDLSYGSYRFNEGYLDVVVPDSSSDFFGFTGFGGINYTLSRPKIDYRILGLEFSYTHEFGSYQDALSVLRNQTASDSNVLVFNRRNLPAFNLYSELLFKLNRDNSLGIEFYGGEVFVSDPQLDRSASFAGYALSYRHKQYTFSLIQEYGQADIRSWNVGLSYRLF